MATTHGQTGGGLASRLCQQSSRGMVMRNMSTKREKSANCRQHQFDYWAAWLYSNLCWEEMTICVKNMCRSESLYFKQIIEIWINWNPLQFCRLVTLSSPRKINFVIFSVLRSLCCSFSPLSLVWCRHRSPKQTKPSTSKGKDTPQHRQRAPVRILQPG